MGWRAYHELTSHTAEALRRSQHFLDWANMADPFRDYDGVPVLDLPADPPTPDIPMLALLNGARGAVQPVDGATFLSQLFFYSAAVSASKRVPATGYRYALRVNPSSGNLHPTEFHFLTRGLAVWPDGFYHYRPSSHMAEQRALGEIGLEEAADASVAFVLTSIAWREAWKYRDRAYRYCLLDIGHAWEALALAARAFGYDSFAVGRFPDDEVAARCRLPEDEWPMMVIRLSGKSMPADGAPQWFGGEPNRLSENQIVYPSIEEIHAATSVIERGAGAEVEPAGSGDVLPGVPASSARSFGETARARRSALDFRGGLESISLAQLSALLAAAAQPLSCDFGGGFIQLYLYVHRVDGLERGVYRSWPAPGRLERVRSGDQRVAAAGLSLGQDLAGNACVAFSMVADMERAAGAHGSRGYRYVHFEAGAVGQRLYLAAEALGLGATGIGAFFDAEVHGYLGLSAAQRVVYHFAIGYPVPDPRLAA